MATKTPKIERAARSATRSAINKLIRKAQTVASKKVRTIYNIKAGDLKKYTVIRRATNSRIIATIQVEGKKLPLILFGAKQKPKGVSVRVRKDTGRKLIRGAWIGVVSGPRELVWKRKGRERFPVRHLRTATPADMYDRAGREAIEQMIAEDAGKTLQHELDFYLSRLKA